VRGLDRRYAMSRPHPPPLLDLFLRLGTSETLSGVGRFPTHASDALDKDDGELLFVRNHVDRNGGDAEGQAAFREGLGGVEIGTSILSLRRATARLRPGTLLVSDPWIRKAYETAHQGPPASA
jgi:hypothetical protein